MTTIYMVRHGETKLNQKKVYYGWTDEPLSPEGEEQCRKLKEKLANIHFDAVLTSPLKRTVYSAGIISGMQDNIFIYEDLKELNFGKWEQLHYLEIEKYYNEEWNCWSKDWIHFCIPDGESFKLFHDRVSCCFKKILEIHSNKTILIVGHAGTLKVISMILLGLPIKDYWKFTFEFGTYSVFEVQKDGSVVIKKINCS